MAIAHVPAPALAATVAPAIPMPRGKGLGRRTMLAGAGAAGVAGAAGLGAAAGTALSALPAAPQLAAAPAVPSGALAAGAAGVAAAVARQIVKVTVQVDRAALVGHLHAYLAAPAGANAAVVRELTSNARLGLPMQILESLLLEGNLTREHVEDFVDGMLGSREEIVFA